MQILHAIFVGWHFARMNRRILLTYFVTNFVLALLGAIPLHFAFSQGLNQNLAGANFAGKMNYSYLIDFLFDKIDFVTASLPVLAIIGGLYVLINLFLAGGTIMSYATDRQRYDPAFFWGSCGHFFLVFIRVLVISLPLYAAAIYLIIPLLEHLSLAVLPANTEFSMQFMAEKTALVLGFLVVMIIPLVTDFARVHIVISGERKALRALAHAVALVFRNFPKAYGMYFYLLLLAALLHLFYAFIADFLTTPLDVVLLLLFFWQQGFIIAKLLLRLTYYGTEVVLYADMTTAMEKARATHAAAKRSKTVETQAE